MYEEEWAELLDMNWTVEKSTMEGVPEKRKPPSMALGMIVQKKREYPNGGQGTVIERVSARKWRVQFDEEGPSVNLSSDLVIVADPSNTYEWTVVEKMECDMYDAVGDYSDVGLCGFDPDKFKNRDLDVEGAEEKPFFKHFLYFYPGKKT